MSMFASSSNDLKIYQWPGGALHQSYLPQDHKDGPIKSIFWGKGGTWMVLVPHSGPAEIISVRENVKLLHTIESIHNPTCAVFQNNTKKNILFGTLVGQVLLYDVKARTVQKRFPKANSEVFSVTCNANDSHFATCCINGDVLLYNNVTSNISHRYKVPKSETVTVVNFHRNVRSLLCAGSEEGMMVVWDINTNAVRYTSLAHHALVTDITFSPIRSDLLVTCGLDRKFSFYDLLSKKCTFQVEVGSSVTTLDFSHCGVYLAMGSQNGYIVLYDTRNLAKPLWEFPGHWGKRVCHLFFQNHPKPVEKNGNSTIESVSEEMLRNDQQDRSSEEAIDSLGFVTCGDINSQTTVETSRKLSHDVEDSFLAQLGLNRSTPSQASLQDTFNSPQLIGEMKNMDKMQELLREANVSYSAGLPVELKTPAVGIKQMSSTPKYLIPEFPTVSPIVAVDGDAPLKQIASASPISLRPEYFSMMVRNAVKEELVNYKKELPTVSSIVTTNGNSLLNASHCNMCTEDLQKIVRNAVKEKMGDYKKEIRVELLDTTMEIRRCFFDLQMYLVKQLTLKCVRRGAKINIRELVCAVFLFIFVRSEETFLIQISVLFCKISPSDKNIHSF